MASSIIIVAMLALGLTGVPVPGLRGALAEQAEHHLGVELSGGELSLRLGEGLALHGAEAAAQTPRRRFRAELPRVGLDVDWRSLLSGEFEIDRIVIEEPVLEFTETETATQTEATADPSTSSPPPFAVGDVVLADASILWREESDEEATRITGVDIRFTEIDLGDDDVSRTGSLLALEGSGELEAERGSFGDVALTDFRCDIYLHEGKLSLSLLKFESAFASFVAEMRLELDRSPFGYVASSLGEPFDVGPFLAVESGGFEGASLLLEMFGRGPTPGRFRAQGSVTLPAGELPRIPLFEAINESVSRELFRPGDGFEQTLAIVRVREGYVLFQTFDFVTERVTATIGGRAYLNGQLELEVELQEPVESGTPRSAASLTVSGTAEEPIVRALPR